MTNSLTDSSDDWEVLFSTPSLDILIACAANGRIDYLNILLRNPEYIELIAGDENAALRAATANGHLAIVERLFDFVDVKYNITVREHEVFRNAVSNQQELTFKADEVDVDCLNQANCIIDFLLGETEVFEYAAKYTALYSKAYIYPFITHKMIELYAKKAVLNAHNPEAVLDINEPDAELYFRIVSFLRKTGNSSRAVAMVDFLLDIPAVYKLDVYNHNPFEANDYPDLQPDEEADEQFRMSLNRFHFFADNEEDGDFEQGTLEVLRGLCF